MTKPDFPRFFFSIYIFALGPQARFFFSGKDTFGGPNEIFRIYLFFEKIWFGHFDRLKKLTRKMVSLICLPIGNLAPLRLSPLVWSQEILAPTNLSPHENHHMAFLCGAQTSWSPNFLGTKKSGAQMRWGAFKYRNYIQSLIYLVL